MAIEPLGHTAAPTVDRRPAKSILRTMRCASAISALRGPWVDASAPGAGDVQEEWVPSGKLTVCYWKWSFIVSFPIENGDFP
jgi:hypothetical protein